MNEIRGFSGENHFLSNFHPCVFTFGGIKYRSSEHAYVAQKTIDENVRNQIASFATPGDAKRFGKKIKIRDGWDQIKPIIMHSILMSKFSIPELKEKLVNTGDAYIEETNAWGDVYWGVCKGTGKNMLGRLLMTVREHYK